MGAGGGYNFSGGMSGGTRLDAPDGLVAIYESESHMGLLGTGVSHFTGTPKITVEGDRARGSATRSSSSRKASVGICGARRSTNRPSSAPNMAGVSTTVLTARSAIAGQP